ncbi:nicotinate-nucleotide adenylyltransferase [Nitrosovibrio tenuis]|uniref:Probable nicotinate-nucleotide adenylyltransferase n=1 Tax=Nitrosovibrio tenuis TaxID=1233 RepID=A0A1H7M0W7_9PROT|nr:nicotinate-nucleotide adenylyltransferase [Nitrosovibrio tenuis]SEL04834.1 nicotinate-nucleotide adenylyltransferase [Nitrosovibrio tenuis]
MGKTGSRLTGIFGGTFDPIHYGHLRVAEEIAEMIRLDEMRFVPAATPRLRCAPVAMIQHRVAMARLAIQGNSRFVLDEREVHRHGVSYSIDSLWELKQELGESIILCFVIGADAFMKLPEWHSWRELFGLCHFVIAARPGHALMTNPDALPWELKEECAERWAPSTDELGQAPGGLIFIAPTTLLDISATNIRARIAAGKSIRYLLPDATLDYIAANHLYSEAG